MAFFLVPIRVHSCSFAVLLLSFFLTFFCAADLVDFDQVSDPPGIVDEGGEATVGESVSTIQAPLTFGALRFYGWYDHTNARQQAANGQALNPANPIILEATTLTARYLDQSVDSDTDSIADWYELFHYGSLDKTPASDTDADGYDLAEELYRTLNPHAADPLQYRYTEDSSPAGLFPRSDTYYAPTVANTPSSSRFGLLSGYRFSHWTVNGARQADALGRALDPITVTFSAGQRVYATVAHYYLPDDDTDADSVADWYERNHYGGLTQLSNADADGDGVELAKEVARDTHPGLADDVRFAALGRVRGPTYNFINANDLSYEIASDPAGPLSASSTHIPGSVVTATAAAAYGPLRFAYWTLNGAEQRAADGRALNPLSFSITVDTVAVAHLIEEGRDNDTDGVADWFELFYYGDLDEAASVDTDGDDYDLAEEFYRGLDPLAADPLRYRYTEDSSPPGRFAHTETYYQPAVSSHMTSNRFGASADYRFSHWTLNGMRQVDSLGRALDPVIVTFFTDTPVYELIAHYLREDDDVDSDGVADGYERNYYDNLLQTATADADGDGHSLVVEAARDTHPGLADDIRFSSLGRVRGAVYTFIDVNDVSFNVVSDPAGYLNSTATYRAGDLLTATANAAYGTLRFAYWTLNGIEPRGGNGRALNPVSFTIQSNTVAVAHLIEEDQDNDDDGIADWYEAFYYSTRDALPGVNTDGDDYDLAEEFYRRLDPLAADPLLYRYTEYSEPAGLFPKTDQYFSPTTANFTGSVRFSEISGYRFSYWTVNGVRRADNLGRALDPVRVAFGAEAAYETVAHYLPVDEDSDNDGAPDWFEWNYYGSLNQPAVADSDADGLKLAMEATRDTHPGLVDGIQFSALSRVRGTTFDYDKRTYFDVTTTVLVDGVRTPFFSTRTSAADGSLTVAGAGHPAVGDWDGDGDLDLFVGGASGELRVFRNAGSPVTLNLVEILDFGFEILDFPAGTVYPTVEDWNGDGLDDLAIGSDDGMVRLYASDGEWEREEESPGGLPAVVGTASHILDIQSSIDNQQSPIPSPGFMDVNGDGRPDLLVLLGDGTVRLYTHSQDNANPYTSFTDNFLGQPVDNGTLISAFDVDDDGDVDVLVSDAVGRIWVFHGDDAGSFTLLSKVYGGSFNGFATDWHAIVDDLDGDGDGDVLGGYQQGGVVLLKNPEAHLFVDPPVQTVLAGESIQFTARGIHPTLTWAMHRNASGGAIDATTGLYTAGAVTGIDAVEAVSADGSSGRVWINVIGASQTAAAGKAIVVSGRRSPNDNIWEATRHLANGAYQALRYRGLSAANIYFLSHETSDNGVDGKTSLTKFQWALTGENVVAAADPSVMIYLADHGRLGAADGHYLFSESEFITGAELDALLDSFQASHPNTTVTLVLECCYAANIMERCIADAPANRVGIASAGTGQLAHFISNGLVSFSQGFWGDIALGLTVQASFADARDAMERFQTAQLTGPDAILERVIGPDFIAGADRPVIGGVNPEIQLSDSETATIWAENVSGPSAIDRVWAVIVPPGYAATGDAPVVDLPEVELQWNSGYQRWQAEYGGFSEGSVDNPYTVILYARDIWGGVSFPMETSVAQAGRRKRAIIMAAGNTGLPRWDAVRRLAAAAWQTCRARRIAAADIRFLSDESTAANVNELATLANLQDAISNWSMSSGTLSTLTVYLVGDATASGIVSHNGDVIAPAAMKSRLDSLQVTAGCDVHLIVESDFSGRYVSGCSTSAFKRVIVTAANENGASAVGRNGWIGFGRWFWSGIGRGLSIRAAFADALVLARSFELSSTYQLDDDGDGSYQKKKDGRVADLEFIGVAFATADDPPRIRKGSPSQYVAVGGTAELWVSEVMAASGEPPAQVWAEVVPPNHDEEQGVYPIFVELNWDDSQQRFAHEFNQFTVVGRYGVSIYAGDPDDVATISEPFFVELFYGEAAPAEELAIDESIPALNLRGDVVPLVLSAAASSATFGFFADPGQRLSFEVTGVSASRDMKLEVLDGDQASLVAADDWGNGFGERIRQWTPAMGGAYYLKISQLGAIGNASLQLRALAERSSGEDGYEEDNVPEQARYIEMTDGAFQEHNFHDEGDEDWVLFYAANGNASYSIVVDAEGPRADVVLSLYAAGDLEHPVQEADGFGSGEEIILLHSQGIFYVQVRQSDSSIFGTGTLYHLRIFQSTGFLSGFLAGLFKTAAGAPLAGTLAIAGIGNFPVPKDGIYALELHPNTYQLTGSAPGYQGLAKTVVVASGAIAQQDFVLTAVAGANQNPTLGAIADPAAILEDASAQTVDLAGIGAGGGESQALTVTATSGSTSLIPNPTVTYTSPNGTGSLSYTPVANASGTAVITVTVRDAGLDGTGSNGDDASTSRTFTVTIAAVNDAPVFTSAPVASAIEDSAYAYNITTADEDGDTVTITATTKPDWLTFVHSGNGTASLNGTPTLADVGIHHVTLEVSDPSHASVTQSFTITVRYKRSLDIDRNGVTEAGKDGLLVIRYLFGFSGPELLTGAGTGSRADNSAALLPILDHAKSVGWLDVDGDGKADALTDGLLVIRYLAQVQGLALTNHAIGTGCVRCAPDTIVDYLDHFTP